MWMFRISSAVLRQRGRRETPRPSWRCGIPTESFTRRCTTGRSLARLGCLTELVRQAAPDHVWQLLDWTARGDVVVVEWQATRTAGGQRIDWRGVDKFRLRDGRIAEETVYMDTAALRAARGTVWPEPLIRLG